MALRTLYAFLGAMMCIGLFLSTQEEYAFSFKPKDPRAAQMVLYGVKNFEITPTGVESITTAKAIERFAAYDVLIEAEALVRNDLHVSFLRAETAHLKGNTVHLRGDVYFARSDELSLESDEAMYQRDTRVLSGTLPFVLTQGVHHSKGESFVFKTKEGELEATRVHAFLTMEKK